MSSLPANSKHCKSELHTNTVFFIFVLKGNEEVKSAPAPVTDAQENRWQHPEKQKTLIHTAPVLSPLQPAVLGAGIGTGTAAPIPISSHCSSAGSAIRAVRGKGREDLAKNNKEVLTFFT
jgi:hypothetical protein